MTAALQRPPGAGDRLWPAVVLSVVVHVGLLAVAALARPPALVDAGQRPITAKLVRLGEPRPKELLPRKEEPPPQAATARQPEPVAPAAAPSPKAVPVPAAAAPAPSPKAASAAVAKAAPPKAPPAGAARAAAADQAGQKSGARLRSVLSELSKELAAGRADGSPDGDSADAGEGDQYLGEVVRQLRQSYRLPTTIGDRERLSLTGTVVLYVEPDGRVSRYELTQRSGNPAFDEALERAVRAARLPPPPPALRDLYRRTGLEVLFRI